MGASRSRSPSPSCRPGEAGLATRGDRSPSPAARTTAATGISSRRPQRVQPSRLDGRSRSDLRRVRLPRMAATAAASPPIALRTFHDPRRSPTPRMPCSAACSAGWRGRRARPGRRRHLRRCRSVARRLHHDDPAGQVRDYAGVAILGASPILIANIPHHRDLDGVSEEPSGGGWSWRTTPRRRDSSELPMYHGASRETPFATSSTSRTYPTISSSYDEEECHTLISRVTGVDGMTPGYAGAVRRGHRVAGVPRVGRRRRVRCAARRAERLPSLAPRDALGRGGHGPHAQLRRHARTALGGPVGVAAVTRRT